MLLCLTTCVRYCFRGCDLCEVLLVVFGEAAVVDALLISPDGGQDSAVHDSPQTDIVRIRRTSSRQNGMEGLATVRHSVTIPRCQWE